MNHDKELVLFLGGEINNNYTKSDSIILTKRDTWILHCFSRDTPITVACTFYQAANESGKSYYISEDLS